jgi:hypothetical protein
MNAGPNLQEENGIAVLQFAVVLSEVGLITKREPFSIIGREPALASYLLSSSPSVAQDLSCYLSCSFGARRESAE